MASAMRFFYLEPFLRRAESHFIEFALATHEYLSHHPEICTVMVGHRALDETVLELLPNVRRGISQTCFENLSDNGHSFLQDLLALDREFSFCPSDLIIIPTAYENQIIACAHFSVQLGTRCPMVAIQLHQLFPPAAESDIIYSLAFRRSWMSRLRRAFAVPRHPNISYWTTESTHLNKHYSRLSGTMVGMLPVPFMAALRQVHQRTPSSNLEELKIGFIGEGRQEKGLLHFLRASRLASSFANRYHFILQLNNPRGFSSTQQIELLQELQLFNGLPLATKVEGGLAPNEHHALIDSIDVLVLPYNPANYWRRISGLLVQAAIQCRPVLASDGTWAAHAIRRNHAAGIVFSYVHGDDFHTASNLADAMRQIHNSYDRFSMEALTRCQYYKDRCHPRNYVNTILRHYGQT